MDPDDVMLVICHSRNTFDKRKLLEKHNPTMKKTDFKIKRFVKEKKIAEFYNSLMDDFKDEKVAVATPGPEPTLDELNPALQFIGRPDASATPMESPSTVPTLEVAELPHPPIALPEHPVPPATPPATESQPPAAPPPTTPQEPSAASSGPSPAVPQLSHPNPLDHPVPSSAPETDASEC
jgi:hypothetical protein